MNRNNSKSNTSTVCFIGMSAKPAGPNGPIKPLCETTLSGKVISSVETKLRAESDFSTFFRDNLVQTPPMTNGRLRYPSLAEMKAEWTDLQKRLRKTKSRVVVLLGGIVSDFFKSKHQITMLDCPCVDGRLLKWAGMDRFGRIILAVAHPSYVGIYARKHMDEYAQIILNAVQRFAQHA